MAKQASTRSLVERFVSELKAVIQMDALEVVRAALGEGIPQRHKARGKAKAARKARKVKVQKTRVRRSQRKAKKAPARREVRVVMVRPRARRTAVEAVPEMVPAEPASEAT